MTENEFLPHFGNEHVCPTSRGITLPWRYNSDKRYLEDRIINSVDKKLIEVFDRRFELRLIHVEFTRRTSLLGN